MTETKAIDKSSWGPGPWQGEADRVDFKHAGLPCLILRHPVLGHFCGYAAVLPGHALHGLDYRELYDRIEVDVHGGLTYANQCSGKVCHVPGPGEPDEVWWFGFDCGHASDLSPGLGEYMRAFLSNHAEHGVYCDLAYVRRQTENLAEQLAGVGRVGKNISGNVRGGTT